jgi:phosphate butyryltransferase
MGFEVLKEKIKQSTVKVKIAVVQPIDKEVFKALKVFCDAKLCHFILVGSSNIIHREAKQIGLTDYEVVNAADDKTASAIAVSLVREHKAGVLMKANVSTDVLLKAVLDKESGLRSGRLLSHLIILARDNGRFLGMTDGGMNIQPNLDEKVDIINNAVKFFHGLGIQEPKVAVLSATEKMNPKIKTSFDAEHLIERSKKGDIPSAVVYGPVAFDLAVSQRAREVKGVADKIPYDADIILVPDIICGNSVAKALIYCAKLHSGGVVLGAQCPIILSSRADTAQERLYSIMLGIMQCIPS